MRQYVYGPVLSRRLGKSLGVDLSPGKVCSFDCRYCQLGYTHKKTIRRFNWVDLKLFSKQLANFWEQTKNIDCVTIAGSGEPTLHKNLYEIIKIIKKTTKDRIPVVLITNGSLLYRRKVRQEIRDVDILIPSLDACDEKTYQYINRPHQRVSFEKLIEGLVLMRNIFQGLYYLEIMLMHKVNDNTSCLKKFIKLICQINPDKVFLNIPERPYPGKKTKDLPSPRFLYKFQKQCPIKCEIVSYDKIKKNNFSETVNELEDSSLAMIVESLKRRPQTKRELCLSLKISNLHLKKTINRLKEDKIIEELIDNEQRYYKLKNE